jgi:hypothetical protein
MVSSEAVVLAFLVDKPARVSCQAVVGGSVRAVSVISAGRIKSLQAPNNNFIVILILTASDGL